MQLQDVCTFVTGITNGGGVECHNQDIFVTQFTGIQNGDGGIYSCDRAS
jgi:hypothetical protein